MISPKFMTVSKERQLKIISDLYLEPKRKTRDQLEDATMLMKSVLFFKEQGFNNNEMINLTKELEPIFVVKGDLITTAGERGDLSLFLILRGKIQLAVKNPKYQVQPRMIKNIRTFVTEKIEEIKSPKEKNDNKKFKIA